MEDLLIHALSEAFKHGCDEGNYHDLVDCLRILQNSIDDQRLRAANEKYGMPCDYNPTHHMENIRWGIVFGKNNTVVSQLILDIFKLKYASSN